MENVHGCEHVIEAEKGFKVGVVTCHTKNAPPCSFFCFS